MTGLSGKRQDQGKSPHKIGVAHGNLIQLPVGGFPDRIRPGGVGLNEEEWGEANQATCEMERLGERGVAYSRYGECRE